MSNARDTETSPLTPEQQQRAEAVACAVAALNQVQHDECVAAFEVVELADYIHTGQLGPHHTPPPVDAEFVGNAPEPDDDETCDIGGCERPIRGVPRTVMDYTDRLCAVHANAPEPEAGDASATVEATECQWPGCWAEAERDMPPTLTVRYATYDYLQPACGAHAGLSVSVG